MMYSHILVTKSTKNKGVDIIPNFTADQCFAIKKLVPCNLNVALSRFRMSPPSHGCLTSSAVPGVLCYMKCWVWSAGTWGAMFISAATASAGYQECCSWSAVLHQVLGMHYVIDW